MIFSLGNLITVCLVLIILIIYRALDRGNRSLEKVKRFSDKIRDGLAAVVEEKTHELKSLSIELGVNLKTGKEVLKRVREVEENLEKKAAGVEDIRARLDNYDKSLAELADMTGRVDENLKRIQSESLFVDKVGKRIGEAAARLTRLEQDMEGVQGRLTEQNRQGLTALRAEATRAVGAHVQSLTGSVAETEKRVKDFSTYLTRLEGRAGQLEQERLASLKKGLEAAEAEAKGRQAGLLNQFTASLAKLLGEAEARGGQLKGVLKEAAVEAGSRLAGHKQWVEQLKGLQAEAERRLEQASSEVQATVLKRVEASLEAYERELEYRFQKIEGAGPDIEALAANLRGAMEAGVARVRQEFAEHHQSLAEERRVERERAQGELAALQTGVQELETGLGELKSKAYENVSAQLEVFEDDFFKDLRQRSIAMEERLKGFQTGLESRLEEVSTGQSAEREALEKRHTQALAGALARARQLADEELARLESRTAELETVVNERAGAAEKRVTELAEAMPARLQVLSQQAQVLHQRELASLSEKAEAELEKLRRTMGTELAAVRTEFASQREELVTGTSEERTALKEEFRSITERLSQLEADLAVRSERALEKFRTDWESFQAEFARRTKETQGELDGRVREVKTRLAESREKAENLQAALFGKIDEGYKTLSGVLADVDKRVKAFTAQTKLFERSDELRVLLESKTEEMKRDLDRLAGHRKDMEELDGRLAATRRLMEELGGKLGRLLSERGRVEGMDTDFRRLLALSKDLDQRLGTVTSSQDALQEIQAKIRELEALEKANEGRFDRLEKKKAILETTISGVDKNFQQLAELEKSLESFRGEAGSLSASLAELRAQTEVLAANKDQAEQVVRKVSGLDGLLADLEGRMEKLEKAREWLAKTETRFEHIGKQAQDQVKLLESILKAEKRQSKEDGGAPALDKRDTVTKLAHLGWSPQEIARTTRLSRGEVELILELAPKK